MFLKIYFYVFLLKTKIVMNIKVLQIFRKLFIYTKNNGREYFIV